MFVCENGSTGNIVELFFCSNAQDLNFHLFLLKVFAFTNIVGVLVKDFS